MPAKNWEDDFRADAIRRSMQVLSEASASDPFDMDESFCIPVSSQINAGLTGGKIGLLFLVLGFGCWGLLGLLAYFVFEDGPPPLEQLILAAALGLAGFVCMFVPAKMQKTIVKLIAGDRVRATQSRVPGAKSIGSEAADGDMSRQEIAIESDDFIVTFFDRSRRRLLIEGTNCRYQIRADDVERMEGFAFTNYRGVVLDYRIGGDTMLSLTLAKPGIFNSPLGAPEIGPRHRTNPLFRAARETLGLPEPPPRDDGDDQADNGDDQADNHVAAIDD